MINLFGEESGQIRNIESQGQGRKKEAKVKGSDLERAILTLAFTMGEDQKAWLRHDFLMLRSQAGKAKGVTWAWLCRVPVLWEPLVAHRTLTPGDSERIHKGENSQGGCCRVFPPRKTSQGAQTNVPCCIICMIVGKARTGKHISTLETVWSHSSLR